VRHALRPHTTIKFCEDGAKIPFDVNHLLIRKSTIGGEGIDFDAASPFRADLAQAITDIFQPGPVRGSFLHLSCSTSGERTVSSIVNIGALAAPNLACKELGRTAGHENVLTASRGGDGHMAKPRRSGLKSSVVWISAAFENRVTAR